MEDGTGCVREAVQRIVEKVQPRAIYLFGSAARGESGPDSDLDLLVIVPDGTDRLAAAARMHACLRGLGCAVDLVIVLESEVRTMRDNPSMVLHTAMTEGRQVYRAA